MELALIKDLEEEIVVVGLGYVGLTLSAYLAQIGMKVHGVEIRTKILSQLKNYKAFFLEKNLDEVLEAVIKNGRFTFSETIPNSKAKRIFLITVGTPLDEHKLPNFNFIESAAQEVSDKLNDQDFVILRSTVKIGVTNQIVRKILNNSNKKYGLAFCPERTLEGAALSELGHLPQIIGADSEEEFQSAAQFFSKVTAVVVRVSNVETAEMVKMVDNMQRDSFFAISNEIAMMCNQINVSASEVILAGKKNYPRTNLALPGPVGGPCLEKDTYILNSSFELPHSLSLTARKINESIIDESLTFINDYFEGRFFNSEPNFKITVVGLAFKGIPETNDLRGSMALRLIERLQSKFSGVEIVGFDAVVSEPEITSLGITHSKTIEGACDNSDLVLLVNNHPSIKDFEFNYIATLMKTGGLIYDYWNRLGAIEVLPNQIMWSSWGSHGVTHIRKLS
jgi:UDP-N-acetyl-D-mannosaminuronic acid dehydrogenase